MKAAAESAMREVVGRSNIQPLLTQARQITETDVQELMQETLDEYGAGVADHPGPAPQGRSAGARSSRRSATCRRRAPTRSALQNEAQTYANRVVPEARGQASQITEAANAYRDQIIAEAQGPGRSLRQGLRELQGRAGRDPPAHLPRDDGAGARRHGQDDHRRERDRHRASCPICRSIALDAGRGCRTSRRGHRHGRRPMTSAVSSAASASSSSSVDRDRRSISASSSSTRRSRRWCFASASPVGVITDARPLLQAAADRQRRLPRQAHPRPRFAAARDHRVRPEAARGRCLRPLQDRRSAAVLPDGRHGRGRRPRLSSSSTRLSAACSATRPSSSSCATSAPSSWRRSPSR